MKHPGTQKAHTKLLRGENLGKLPALLLHLYSLGERHILRWGSILAVLILWEVAVNVGVIPELFVSSPTGVLKAAVEVIGEGTIWNDMWVSGKELFSGYALSIATGVPLGMLLGWYRRARMAGELFVSFFYAMPRAALLPLLIIWFGIGIYSKIALVFLGSFFPILMSTSSGVQNLDESLVLCSRSFGSNDWQLFRTVALPASIPFILVGCRLGIARALIGVVVGELYGAAAGVGFFIANAGSLYQTDRVMFGIIIISIVGVLLIELMDWLERRFQRWRPELQQIT
jgi:ABC-type nitrate/sulfonate/bicarbonate transport system permease component